MRRGIVALVVFGALTGTAHAAPTITTLSNRADLISGGDVLTQVAPRGAEVRVNGRDVTDAFAVRRDGRYLGLIRGLETGRSVVTAKAGGRTAQLTVTNHPSGGPVLSGPQIQPWPCFAGALDEQCSREPRFAFYYRSTAGGPLRPYDRADPPADVAATRTIRGRRIPFIVREEVGTLNRDEYRVAALYDPAKPYRATRPQAGNAGKLLINHGFACDTGYGQATAPGVLNATALARGFVVMSHALDNSGHNCNIATQAESLIMTKEHVVDTYGTVRYTIGTGCSGGSLVQQQVANAYPGLYQGITPQCSFPDTWSSANQYVDYEGMRRYFETPSRQAPGTRWTPAKVAAAEGHVTPDNAVNFTRAIASSGDPSRPCPGVDRDDVFDPRTNPDGVRCSLQDYMVNVFGRDADTGYALRPADNVGVQYGLKALRRGVITPAEFADLNAKLGGRDIDYEPTRARTAGDPAAIRRVYRSGAINQADHLDEVAIIDLRGPDEGTFHDVVRTYTVRARLKREHGTAANQVLWRGQTDLIGDADFADEAILAMDRWLARVDADRRAVPLAQKIRQDRPASVRDRCTDRTGEDVGPALCNRTVRAYSTPRQVAGEKRTDDTEKCALKRLRRGDYGDVTFTDAQWASLRATFPSGVCDWSKPGANRVPTSTWQTYQRASGRALYGGRSLGAAPRSTVVPRARVSIRRSCRTGQLRVRIRGVRVRWLQVGFGRRLDRVEGRELAVNAGRRRLTVRVAIRLSAGGTVDVKRTLPAC